MSRIVLGCKSQISAIELELRQPTINLHICEFISIMFIRAYSEIKEVI